MAFKTEQIKHTLSTILHAQGDHVAAEVLDMSRVEVTYVERDFGNDVYSLDLRIPTERFAELERNVDKIQGRIQQKLWKLGLDGENSQISLVRVYPELSIGPGAISVPIPTHTDEKRIWKPGRVRLFLSHVSRVKVPTSELKRALMPLGIDSFVAHEDIKPTKLWHQEIEFALRSMDALCAIVTEDFVRSEWADQEVGFALGRGVPVVALSCGVDPYGLLGKHQALRADINRLGSSSKRLAEILADQDHLRPRLVGGLVDALAAAISYQDAKDGINRIVSLQQHLSSEQVMRLLEAARDNSQVREATGVPEKIQKIATARKIALPEHKKLSLGDFEDDIPF